MRQSFKLRAPPAISVGVDKIRELRHGQFACTACYPYAAREFARDNQVNLLDGESLLASIAKRSSEQQRALLDVALEGEYWKPTGVNCVVKMVFRVPRNEGKEFWGCVNYPKCRARICVQTECLLDSICYRLPINALES